MISPTELTGDNIIVRPLCAADVRPLYEAARESISEVSVWLPWCHPNYTIEETEEFIGGRGRGQANDEWYSFGIFDKATGRFLGGMGLNFINRPSDGEPRLLGAHQRRRPRSGD